MKKLLLLLLFIPLVSFFYFFVSGFKVSPDKKQISLDPDLKGYFVDAKNGDDENSGKQLGSPWKTVEKINSIIFEPGDNVYFKRGTSYYHGLQINGNGTKDNPITVSAYGEVMLRSLQIPMTVYSMGMQFK
jgi:signal peptidase I